MLVAMLNTVCLMLSKPSDLFYAKKIVPSLLYAVAHVLELHMLSML